MASKPLLSILVPCYNETDNLGILAERTYRALRSMDDVSFEMVLVDDGSEDDTWKVIEELASKYTWIMPVKHGRNLGMAEAWATALAKSRGEYIVIIDADLQYRPEDIPTLWRILTKNNAEMVQGARNLSSHTSPVRYLSSKLYSFMLKFIFGVELSDVKSVFILYKRKILEEIMEDRKRFRYFQHFMTIAARHRGYSILETSVAFDQRSAGRSFIKNIFLFGLKSLSDLPTAIKLYGRKGV